MTTATTFANAAITNDATFRAWGTVVSAAFASAGLVQTSDTGQINWTTVLKPTAAITLAGYEIWRFNDSLQGTAPIFLKISYYSGQNTSGNSPALRVTVGTGSNGTGAITGVNTGLVNTTGSSTTSASDNTNECIRLSTSPGVLVVALDTFLVSTPSCAPSTFIISRTIDSTGNPTAEGCYFFYHDAGLSGSTGSLACRSLNFTTVTAFGPNNPNAAPPGDLINYDSGNVAYVLPHYACIPHPVLVNGVASIKAPIGGGWAEGTLFECDVAGGSSPNTYLALGAVGTGTSRFDGGTLMATVSMSGLTNEGAYRWAIGVIWE